jgi:ribonuclease-3 family protein
MQIQALFPPEELAVDIRELSPLSLAFVGDSVLELLVRRRLVCQTRLHPGALNTAKVKYVSAHAQYREQQLLEPYLTEEEMEWFKRGRNATKASVSKHATPAEYRASTGFECLLGWLYLTGRTARVSELFELLWAGFDPAAPHKAAEKAGGKPASPGEAPPAAETE